jgi:hypothetical protein
MTADGDTLVPICPSTLRGVTWIPISEAVSRRSQSQNTCSGATTARVAPTPSLQRISRPILATRGRDPVLNRPKDNAEILRHVDGGPRRVAQPSVARLVRQFPVVGASLARAYVRSALSRPNDRHAMHQGLAACRGSHTRNERTVNRGAVRHWLIGSDRDPDCQQQVSFDLEERRSERLARFPSDKPLVRPLRRPAHAIAVPADLERRVPASLRHRPAPDDPDEE